MTESGKSWNLKPRPTSITGLKWGPTKPTFRCRSNNSTKFLPIRPLSTARATTTILSRRPGNQTHFSNSQWWSQLTPSNSFQTRTRGHLTTHLPERTSQHPGKYWFQTQAEKRWMRHLLRANTENRGLRERCLKKCYRRGLFQKMCPHHLFLGILLRKMIIVSMVDLASSLRYKGWMRLLSKENHSFHRLQRSENLETWPKNQKLETLLPNPKKVPRSRIDSWKIWKLLPQKEKRFKKSPLLQWNSQKQSSQ